MAPPQTPKVPDRDVNGYFLSSPRYNLSLSRPQHYQKQSTRTKDSVVTSSYTSYYDLLDKFEVQQSPTSVTTARREQLRQQLEMERMERLRQQETPNYEESETSDGMSPKT